MKTNEFIKRINELGYGVFSGSDEIRVCRDNSIFARVSKSKVNKLDTLWEADIPYELFDVLVSYASTPVKERKDHKNVKKYYLYHPAFNGYFNYHKIDKYYVWGGVNQTIDVQTMFTEEEIENNKFRDIMELLEKVSEIEYLKNYINKKRNTLDNDK